MTGRAEIGRVLVTGAAGRLGTAVAALLHEEGVDVVATDLRPAPDRPYRFVRADLRDHEAAWRVLDGIDVLVHIGNHPGLGDHPPQQVFNENVAVNENMFQGAAERGVGRIVFASTLQLIGSHVDGRTVVHPPAPPAYPLHGDTPPDPSNVYALSKSVSEVMLRYYAERCGIDCVALRFPMLHRIDDERVLVAAGEETPTDVLEGFTGLTYADAAAAFLAVIGRDLPGYRVFMPGTSHRHRGLSMPELLRVHYPDLPPDTGDLIDISRIVTETGWQLGPGYERR